MPLPEMIRLEAYFNFLNLPAVSRVGMMFEPAPTSGMYELFSSLFAKPRFSSFPKAVSDSGDEYSDHDGDERSEDAYNFLRAMAPGCSDIEEVVERHDHEKEAMLYKTVSDWIGKILEPENWLSTIGCETSGAYVDEASDEESE